TPERLKGMVKQEVTVKLETDRLKNPKAFDLIEGVQNYVVKEKAQTNSTSLTFILEDDVPIADIMSEVLKQGSKVQSMQKIDPTLEEVFITLVGRGLD
ncbi:MAG: DUF4162 domain-containing protein, partial [Thermoplasmata archaeon]